MRTIIYEEALNAMKQYDGSLPNSFKVYEPIEKIRYKNGWIQEAVQTDAHLFDNVFEALRMNKPSDAFHLTDKIFADGTDMDDYEQVLENCIQQNQALLETPQMKRFIESILKYTIYPQAVKFALLIADHMQKLEENLIAVIKVYAQIAVFSERALHILQHQENGNNIIYALAKTTYGTVKNYAIHALQADDAEIKDWLLHCCGKDADLYYVGIDIYRKCNIDQMLNDPNLSEDNLTAIGHILLALDDECPVLVESERACRKTILDPVPLNDLTWAEWRNAFDQYYSKVTNIINQDIVNDFMNFYTDTADCCSTDCRYIKQHSMCISYLSSTDAERFRLNWICEYGIYYLYLNENDDGHFFFVDPSEYAVNAIHEHPEKIYYADVIFNEEEKNNMVDQTLDKIDFMHPYDEKSIQWLEKNILNDTDTGDTIRKHEQKLNEMLQADFTHLLKNKTYMKYIYSQFHKILCMESFAVVKKLEKDGFPLEEETKRLCREAENLFNETDLNAEDAEIKMEEDDEELNEWKTKILHAENSAHE